VNAAVEAIAKGQDRVLLVMATGTGKTYTAFQIIWRLWKAKQKKRILYLADRNVLIDQTMVNDFRPFGPVMAKLSTGNRAVRQAKHSLQAHHAEVALHCGSAEGEVPPLRRRVTSTDLVTVRADGIDLRLRNQRV
jgi:type I site-specific restriction endonuclease